MFGLGPPSLSPQLVRCLFETMAPRAGTSRSQRNASQPERRSSRRAEPMEEDEEEEIDMYNGEDEPEVNGVCDFTKYTR